MECEIELRNTATQECVVVRISDAMLYDRLLALSAEYSISAEALVNIAIRKLIDDVDLVRRLRAGWTESK